MHGQDYPNLQTQGHPADTLKAFWSGVSEQGAITAVKHWDRDMHCWHTALSPAPTGEDLEELRSRKSRSKGKKHN